MRDSKSNFVRRCVAEHRGAKRISAMPSVAKLRVANHSVFSAPPARPETTVEDLLEIAWEM